VATGEGPPPAIAQVLIDDHSIRQLEPIVGRWPWPRMVHAVLVDFLARGPAKLVVYDVLFSEEAKGTADIGGTTWTGRESDDALVESVAKANVIRREASSEARRCRRTQVPLDAIRREGRLADHRLCRTPAARPPFQRWRPRGLSHARFAYDPTARPGALPFVDVGGRIVPSLPVAAMIAVRGLRRAGVSVRRAHARHACPGWSRSFPTTTVPRQPCGARSCRSVRVRADRHAASAPFRSGRLWPSSCWPARRPISTR
jgi:adenylate cyclase